MTSRIVIVGAGLAGAKAAQTLRREGFEGEIVMFGAEAHRPYERPPLSKGLLLGAADEPFVHPAEWYPEHKVDLRTGYSVDAIDLPARTVTASTGDVEFYDRLLLATGSSPITLRVPGATLDGVHYLRTLDDSRAIAAAMTEGVRVVIIGGGWIGLEVAAAARQRGASVAVVETSVLPLLRVLGTEIAETYADLHRSHGVTFHLAASVSRIDGVGCVSGVSLADGTVLPADVVVVGVGIRPNSDLAARAGIAVSNGIVTDAGLLTSDPAVYACGDVANSWSPLLDAYVRVEHWENAKAGGVAAARSMLGQPDTYADHLPYFYSDQYDVGMEYFGYVAAGEYDQIVVRGEQGGRLDTNLGFLAFWVKGARVLAGMNVNIWDAQEDIRKLVRAGLAGHAADLGRLADTRVPLADVLG